jgi:hypothetical protein
MPDGTPIPIGGIAAREADPTITNCIIGRNGTAGTWGDGLSYGDDLYPDEIGATFSCIENPNDVDGEGNIDDDPLFISGGLGNYYLFQEHYDRTQNSPCVNAGEQYILVDLQRSPPDGYNLDIDITTSIQNYYDFGFTDMGYHYPFYYGPPVMYQLRIEVVGNGSVDYYQDGGYLGTIVSGASDVNYFLPGTQIWLDAHADPNHWGYWFGTDNDDSFNTWNNVTMYSDRDVVVEFEPILRRKLHVPADYALLQDAIDAAKYKDTVVLAAGGSNNPYFTSQGFVIGDNKAITITSVDPNDPATVAATVIEMEAPQDGGWVGSAFTFYNVGPDTVLNGITIRGFQGRGLDGLDGDDPAEPGGNGGSVYGMAIDCYYASPTIKNCVITDCNLIGGDGGNGQPGIDEHPDGAEGGWPGAAGGAGLACFFNSNPTVINCTFDNCRVRGGNGGDGGDGLDWPPGPRGLGGRGGGWYYGADSIWYKVSWPFGPYEFYTEYSGRGGAVFVGGGCKPRFIDCTFTNNSSEGGLCGICGIDGNPAPGRQKPGLRWKIDNFGAAAFCDDGSQVEFDNCSFINNLASPNRPARDYNEPYDPVTNYDNDDLFVGFGGAVAFKNNADVTFNDCKFEHNTGDKGGAIHCTDATPQINDCSFVGNSAQTGGAVLFARGYGRIAQSDFIENEAIGSVGRGGAICSLGSNALIVDCNVRNNSASESGGGAYVSSKNVDGNDLVIDGNTVFGYNKVVFFNCLITKNTACDDGGGISANFEAEPDIISCTIADNAVLEECGSDIGYGGGLESTTGSYATVIDSIIWGNSAQLGSQIAIGITPSPSVIEVVASDVQGAQSNAYVGTGSTLDWDANNLYINPLFVSGPLGGYYLSQIVAGQLQESPCVDAGSDLAARVGMSKYTTRTDEVFDGGIVDMGYHHSFTTMEQPCKFCNLSDDGIINFSDFAILASSWLDEGCTAGNNWCLDADLTFDTRVNLDDLLVFIECWLVEDTTPPEPNPSKWERKPYSVTVAAPYRISMTAKPAVDIWSGTVEYYFDCAYGNCHDRNWSSSNAYTDSGLAGFTEYGYRVKARDGSGNETGWSSIDYAIAGTEDREPPSPDPLTWAVAPHSTSSASISMTATTATDESGVEYYFECVTDDVNSGWQDSPTWQDTGLEPSTTYTYRVKARDTSAWQNETGWSILADATTPEEDLTPPTPNPMTWATAPYATSPTSVRMVATTATDASGVEYYFQCTSHSQYSSGWQGSPIYAVTVTQGAMYTFVVRARDLSPNRNTTGNSTAVTVDLNPPTPNPMTWATAPYATSPTSVRMVATTATDASGVEYYFQCTSHSQYSSSWQGSPIYAVTVAQGAMYTFVVRARDMSPNRNTTGNSTAVTVDLNPPTPNPMTWATVPYRTSSTSVSMTASVATDVSGVEYYFQCTSHSGYNSGWQTGRTYTVSGLPKGLYTFVVRARDMSPARNTTGNSIAVTVDLNPPGPVAWEIPPYESGSGFNAFANMTAREATDPEGGAVEYYFECVDIPQFSSGWIAEREYQVMVGRELQGLRFRFRVRDDTGSLSDWSTTLRSYPPF